MPLPSNTALAALIRLHLLSEQRWCGTCKKLYPDAADHIIEIIALEK